MISKGLKKRIIAGFVGLSLVGGTSVFALTDAGTKLQSWYDSYFEASTKAAWTEAYNYGTQEAGKAYSWFLGKVKGATSVVATEAANKAKDANAAINTAKGTALTQLDNKNTSIQTAMPGQYDGFIRNKNEYVSGEALKYYNLGFAQAGTDINGAGATGVTAVQTSMNPIKDGAVNALKDRLAAIKTGLAGKIGTEQSTAVDEIKANIGREVTTREGLIQTEITRLEGVNKKVVSDEAQRIQDEATTAMEAVINAIPSSKR